ncbi:MULTISPECIES: hypothetical protein [unclassified Achromobacter]|uniref:hypothetical protein n=1 Tax=unclassified Achromobacter TaxID=2626865 RepID=UPI0008B04BBF|nr:MULTISPECIES: hypothetical protein [unclassified Achromobacter]SEJ79815.1 hypothetical protein SAMN03159494_03383 [Achromobacter sp. NFACC18-2]SIT12406.1 hypothetical protein SAMN05428937_1057 [Achromobacter sp. MFA1 R4]
MTNTLIRFFRAVLFAALALIGMAMALVFMLSTAVAVAILYVVAKVRGKPFGVRAYWSQRQGARPGPFQSATAPFATQPRGDVIDVEAREIR